MAKRTVNSEFPEGIYVYICDYDSGDGSPILCAVSSLEEVPDSERGNIVAGYTKDSEREFVVERSLR